jgi:hypothetical protein
MAKITKYKDANQSAKDLLDRIIEKTESPSFSKGSKKGNSIKKPSSKPKAKKKSTQQ